MAKKYTTEEARERMRIQRQEWRLRNPDKVKEKQKRDNELAKERRAKRSAEKVVPEKPTGKVCKVCGERKELDLFPVHGTGKSSKCKSCTPPPKSRYEIQRVYELKNRQKINATKLAWAKKNKPAAKAVEPKPPKIVKPKSATDGWLKIFAEADPHESLTVWRRGPLLMFQRCQLGVYSLGKRSWAVVGDDSGKRYETLSKAEAAARRKYGTGRELSA